MSFNNNSTIGSLNKQNALVDFTNDKQCITTSNSNIKKLKLFIDILVILYIDHLLALTNY